MDEVLCHYVLSLRRLIECELNQTMTGWIPSTGLQQVCVRMVLVERVHASSLLSSIFRLPPSLSPCLPHAEGVAAPHEHEPEAKNENP